jgi:type I restriction enzyme M protein
MITSERRGQIDRLWKELRAKGLTGTVDLVEQISFLLFLWLLENRKESGRGLTEAMKACGVSIDVPRPPKSASWSTLMAMSPSDRYVVMAKQVYPWLQSLARSHTGTKSIAQSARMLIQDGNTLDRVMRQIQDIGTDEESGLAEFYDYLTERMSKRGRNGVFKTPTHLAELMVQLANPREEQMVCDPACGTGGLLIEAGKHVLRTIGPGDRGGVFWRSWTKCFIGCECNHAVGGLAAINMFLHHHDPANIVCGDALDGALSNMAGRCDVIVTTLPFGGDSAVTVVKEGGDGKARSRRRDVWFCDAILELLREDGRAVVLAPGSILSAQTKQHRLLRKRLVVESNLKQVVSLPPGVFLPHTDAATAILVFDKCARSSDSGQSSGKHEYQTGRVLFYACTGDGYSLNARRKQLLPDSAMGCKASVKLSSADLETNNLPEILSLAKSAGRYEQGKCRMPPRAFFVTADRIADNDFDLSMDCYRPKDRRLRTEQTAAELLALIREDERRMADDIRLLERLLK